MIYVNDWAEEGGGLRAGCLYGKEISADSGKEHSAPGAGTTACLENK